MESGMRTSTMPIRQKLITRVTLVSLALLMAVSAPLSVAERVAADQWDNQINALRAQADQYRAQANQLRAHGNTLQAKLDEINAQINALTASIQANQARHDQLQADIEANKVKLSQSQDMLGEILADLYVDGSVSELEMIAGSQNIGEFVDRQEYRASVRDQLNSMIADVKKIKKKLEVDKQAVDKVLAELKQQNDQLGAQQAEQQSLVDQTRGEEAAYQQLLNNAQNSMAAIRAQQQAYYASLGGGAGSGVVGNFSYWGLSPGNGAGGCTGGYPYCSYPAGTYTSYAVDPWNLYMRECVSYVAWALKYRFGKNVQPWHGDGHAYQWPSSAARWSGAWRVYDPQPGDVVVLPRSGGFAPVGHVMIVESVSGGNMFVSQYNFYGTGQYSTMWVANSGVILLRFPG
jgi:peptidoglycan hydrolase CwlO-like protein